MFYLGVFLLFFALASVCPWGVVVYFLGVVKTFEVQISSRIIWLSWNFKRVAVAFDTKDPKTHLNSKDASYRGHSCFRGKMGSGRGVGRRKGKEQDRN